MAYHATCTRCTIRVGAELTVPGAIARGTLRQDEIDPSLLQNLAELIQFAKRRQEE